MFLPPGVKQLIFWFIRKKSKQLQSDPRGFQHALLTEWFWCDNTQKETELMYEALLPADWLGQLCHLGFQRVFFIAEASLHLKDNGPDGTIQEKGSFAFF